MRTREELMTACPAGMNVEIVVPVFNEDRILRKQLRPILLELPENFRISVIENGSTDSTIDILENLSKEFPAVSFVSLPRPDYGKAMKEGLERATAAIAIVDDLDVMDTDFWTRGLGILKADDADIVQGSKVLAGKDDRRPFVRKAATLVLTGFLRILLGFRGTDTHGPKVMFRERILPVMKQCSFELDLYPTELVIRAQRSGIRILEIPIHLREIRSTPLPLYRRVPRALRDLWKLSRALR